MSLNKILVVLLFLLSANWSECQKTDARGALEQTLQSRYRLTIIGGGFMGVRGDNSIRRAGGVVVLLRDGLYASKDRSRLASDAVRNERVEVFSGDKDVALARGEKFYVTAIHVGSEVVTMGLVSVRSVPIGPKVFPVWCSVNFFFPVDTLTQGDPESVYRVIDQWLVPEGGSAITAPPNSAPPASGTTLASAPVTSAPSLTRSIELNPGMTREEVIHAMGTPLQEVEFGNHRWLTYQGITTTLQDSRLISVEANGTGLTPVNVSSDPNGADIFLDGKFVSSTPALLRLRPATYKITVKMSGYAEWERDVKVLPSAEVNLDARLSK
jgi:hypothetical protein